MRKVSYFIPAFLWGLFILWASLTSGKQLPKVNIISFDKIAHLGVYGILAMLTAWGLHKTERQKQIIVFILASIMILYGVLIEFGQYYFTLDRHFEYADAIANSLGVIIGFWIVNLFLNYKNSK